jgi:putative SOS response-associated peptidase YedK
MINARAETVAVKPAFKRALTHGRCVIPASGYYEWKRRPHGQPAVPMLFHLAGSGPMAFAGLYDHWESPQGATLRPWRGTSSLTTC